MRDNGIPEGQGQVGLDWLAGLAREALSRLVSVRDQQGAEIDEEHLDVFLTALASESDPDALLDTMTALHIDPEMVACCYASEAARILGEDWTADRLSFVDVTIRIERLHALVRRADARMDAVALPQGPSALVLVAEAEQHTLGAFVLALQLRLAGMSVIVRVAPAAAELTMLLAGSRFDLALVSIGCTAGLESGIGLVRTLRLLSRGGLRIFVGGAIPLPDNQVLAETGADRVLRDVAALVAEYDGCKAGRTLDRAEENRQRGGGRSSLKGDRGEK